MKAAFALACLTILFVVVAIGYGFIKVEEMLRGLG